LKLHHSTCCATEALFAREEGESRDIARLADAQGRALLKPRLQFFEQSAKQFCSTMHRAARSDPGGAKQQNQTGVLFNRQEMH
jgi:hypothetical protein